MQEDIETVAREPEFAHLKASVTQSPREVWRYEVRVKGFGNFIADESRYSGDLEQIREFFRTLTNWKK